MPVSCDHPCGCSWCPAGRRQSGKADSRCCWCFLIVLTTAIIGVIVGENDAQFMQKYPRKRDCFFRSWGHIEVTDATLTECINDPDDVFTTDTSTNTSINTYFDINFTDTNTTDTDDNLYIWNYTIGIDCNDNISLEEEMYYYCGYIEDSDDIRDSIEQNETSPCYATKDCTKFIIKPNFESAFAIWYYVSCGLFGLIFLSCIMYNCIFEFDTDSLDKENPCCCDIGCGCCFDANSSYIYRSIADDDIKFELVSISQLKIGDIIMSGVNGECSKIIHCVHYNNNDGCNKRCSMRRLWISGNKNKYDSITLTAGHLIYAAKANNDNKKGLNFVLVPSREVMIGDYVLNKFNNAIKVVKIDDNVLNCFPRLPITENGFIIVNNMLASVYTGNNKYYHYILHYIGLIFYYCINLCLPQINNKINQEIVIKLRNFIYWNIVKPGILFITQKIF